MPIIRNGQWSEDGWAALADEDALPVGGAITVSLKRFQAERSAAGAQGPFGCQPQVGRARAAISADRQGSCDDRRGNAGVSGWPRVLTARLLRERYGYTGEIRAGGHILPDQVLFLARCGVNSFDIKPERRLEPFAEALREYSVGYQSPRSARGRSAGSQFQAQRLRVRSSRRVTLPSPLRPK